MQDEARYKVTAQVIGLPASELSTATLTVFGENVGQAKGKLNLMTRGAPWKILDVSDLSPTVKRSPV